MHGLVVNAIVPAKYPTYHPLSFCPLSSADLKIDERTVIIFISPLVFTSEKNFIIDPFQFIASSSIYDIFIASRERNERRGKSGRAKGEDEVFHLVDVVGRKESSSLA